MAPRQRISARDFKHGGGRRSKGLDFARYTQFGAGLAAGLVVALAVWVYDHRAQPEEDVPVPRPMAAAGDPAEATEDPEEQFDFYNTLARSEVVLPEQDRNAQRDRPSIPVVRPGAYVLQVGSSRSQPDAERLREKLARQGMDASIQKVTVDEDEWYRVRVGPIRDLDKLNATRRTLRAAGYDVILYNVGD